MPTKNRKKTESSRTEVKRKRNVARPIIMFVIALFLLAAAIIGDGAPAWLAIHNFILGVFGFFGFVVPVLLGAIAVTLELEGSGNKAFTKLIEASVLCVIVAAFIHIVAVAGDVPGFKDAISVSYNSGWRSTGVIGAFIGYPIYALFGNPGAWIVTLLLALLIFMLMTGTTIISLFKTVSRPVKRIEEVAEDAYSEAAVRFAEADERAREKRKDPKAYDIPLDDEAPAVRTEKPSLETQRKNLVEKYREEDKRPVEDISSVSEERRASDARRELFRKTADAISEKADSDDGNEMNDINDIIQKVNGAAEKKEEKEEPTENTVNDSGFAAPPDSKIKVEVPHEEYKFPPISLLSEPSVESQKNITAELESTATLLVDTLRSFGVESRIINISRGPSVTRYELQPAAGVKISKITNLADDIALNLATAGVRIEAPIPNKPAVGIEVPNKYTSMVKIREIIDSQVFSTAKGKLTAALGRDISGEQRVTDISKMPHGLIAGATGSGKSVCINSIIMSILYKATPEDVKLLLIDPKVVELAVYNGIPHLIVPVVTDPRKAAGALGWAVLEMEKRYKMFAENDVRNIAGYNDLAEHREDLEKMPQIVIIIDELADLMMTSPAEVEDSICRIAQKARAAGMHLIVATQRPSVDVVTGLIKANIPTRIAFAVSSQVDSRTIIDVGGAEKLMGKGDMLFFPTGAIKPERIQGCFVSDDEVERVVAYLKSDHKNDYDEDVMNEIERQAVKEKAAKSGLPEDASDDGADPMLDDAIDCVVEVGQASTSLLQRRLRLGYARAARIIDQMEERGVVGPYEGSKPRQVLVTKAQLLEKKASSKDVEEQ